MATVIGPQRRLAMVARQVAALQRRYPGFALIRRGPGRLVVAGMLGFKMEHKERPVEDEFHIELEVPADYPNSPPEAYEVAGRLKDFDHLFKDGELCLGAPVEVRMRFATGPDLLSFIQDLVIPFLFAFSYKSQYGEMPFGELAHGAEGILDYYNDYFGTPTEGTVLLLKWLADDVGDNRQTLGMCPCGNGSKLKRCHGSKLAALRLHQTAEYTKGLLKDMVSGFRTVGDHRRPLLPRRLRRKLGD